MMLQEHMNRMENALISNSNIQNTSGHSLHKGTPRENFIKIFLESHLPQNVSIASGELIDAQSMPGQKRNQFDIVLYRKNYPRIKYDENIFAFLIESVVATIEVKSTLKEEDLEKAIKAAHNAKSLQPSWTTSFYSGHIPPKPLNFVVAYDGPENASTLKRWIDNSHTNLRIKVDNLPLESDQRASTASPSIDGVFILKKSFIYYDNTIISHAHEIRKENPSKSWVASTGENGALLMFFLLLLSATSNVDGRWLDPMGYISNFRLSNIEFL